MRECSKKCLLEEQCCVEEECRMWIDFPEDNNCTLIAVNRHGPMTLKEIAERHHISIVRVKQIVDATLGKIKSVVMFDRY
jgi:hypothetical protein